MRWRTLAPLGSVVVVEQNLKATEYMNIIPDQLHPYIASVFANGNGMFQQDDAQCHKAWIDLEWFHEYDAIFPLMFWPPNSLDLNPIGPTSS